MEIKVAEKLTFDDLINYFENEIPKELGLKYPEANGKIARMIIEEEMINDEFLPGTMPARDRAAFAIPIFAGSCADIEKQSKIEKYFLFATLLILKHRHAKHSQTPDDKYLFQKEIESTECEISEKGHSLTEKEILFLEAAAGYWGPG